MVGNYEQFSVATGGLQCRDALELHLSIAVGTEAKSVNSDYVFMPDAVFQNDVYRQMKEVFDSLKTENLSQAEIKIFEELIFLDMLEQYLACLGNSDAKFIKICSYIVKPFVNRFCFCETNSGFIVYYSTQDNRSL
jgi:hypothetical protein